MRPFAFAPLLALATLLVVAPGSLGCASQPRGPNDTLRAYALAVRERRIEDAYALLATDAKRSMSLEAFRRMVNENAPDMDELSLALARPASDPIVTATVTTPQGDQVVLVFEHGQWRVDADSLDLYSQATPRQAIKAFLRAFDKQRYDLLLRFVPDSKKMESDKLPALDEARLKESWQGPQKEEMNRVVQGIRAALPQASIEETNDRATMPYGSSGTLQLVREHGIWKIEHFD